MASLGNKLIPETLNWDIERDKTTGKIIKVSVNIDFIPNGNITEDDIEDVLQTKYFN